MISTCSTVVMIVDAAGRAERQERPAVVEHDRRRHRASAGACPGRAGSGRPGRTTAKLKSVSSLLSRKPRPGTTMPVAAGLLDGEGVLDDVAPPVGDGQVRGALALGRPAPRRRALARSAQPPSYAVGVARRDRRRDRVAVGSIGQARSAANAVASSASRRHVGVRRVADIAAAVGERERAGLQVAVQRLRSAVRGRGRALQDVERLADGRARRTRTAACRRPSARGSRRASARRTSPGSRPGRGRASSPGGPGGRRPRVVGPAAAARSGRVARRARRRRSQSMPLPTDQPVGRGEVGVA